MRCAVGAVVVVVALATTPGAAHAGRTDYGWLFGTDVMPERGVELQTWVWETNGRYGPAGAKADTTGLWWAPVIGITDRLELSLPLEAQDSGTGLGIADYGLDLRYRFVSADPVEAGPVIPVVRAAVKRAYGPDGVLAQADAILGYEHGPVHALLDLGGDGLFVDGAHTIDLRPGAGFSISAAGGLRVGAEVFADVRMQGVAAATATETRGEYTWVAAGPNLAWTYGRFWFSGAFGIGVYQIHTAPRIQWGIAF